MSFAYSVITLVSQHWIHFSTIVFHKIVYSTKNVNFLFLNAIYYKNKLIKIINVAMPIIIGNNLLKLNWLSCSILYLGEPPRIIIKIAAKKNKNINNIMIFAGNKTIRFLVKNVIMCKLTLIKIFLKYNNDLQFVFINNACISRNM